METITTYPTVPAVVAAMRAEITELIAAGSVPATVSSFAELHDYVDANMLANDLFPQGADDEDDDDAEDRMTETVNRMNGAMFVVNQWLANGRPELPKTETVTRLYMSDGGETVCERHGGGYLRSAIQAKPKARTYRTPLGCWTAYTAADTELALFPCEACGATVTA